METRRMCGASLIRIGVSTKNFEATQSFSISAIAFSTSFATAEVGDPSNLHFDLTFSLYC